MKKILYFVFFISLFFIVNVNSVKAATGYCEYSLTRFSKNNGIFTIDNEDDATIRFTIDTSKKNKVEVKWGSKLTILSTKDKSFQIYDKNSNLINYKLGFDSDELYSKIVKGDEFSCPKIYGLYTADNFYLEIYYNSRESGMGSTSIELNLLDQKKPSNLNEETLINECGIGISEGKYGLPKDMTIVFKKYTNRNSVCITYFQESPYCQDYKSGQDLIISTETAFVSKRFSFNNSDLRKIFNGMTSNAANCPNFWIDSSNSSSGVFKVTLENPNSGLDAEMTTDDYQQIQESQQFIDGSLYQKLLGELKSPLSALDNSALNISLTVDGSTTTLNSITASDELCKEDVSACTTNARYLTEKGLKNIRSYCNEIYSAFSENKNDAQMNKRMDECIDFDDFYNTLVDQGTISNLVEDGCGMITEELAEKLNYFLDIIKIAGPLIALGLGTVDFIRVIANGDADKEMKNAFKRFMIRIGAAALLFIIPIIVAFLLDIFMKPDSGYESDNPFCSVIDWDE